MTCSVTLKQNILRAAHPDPRIVGLLDYGVMRCHHAAALEQKTA